MRRGGSLLLWVVLSLMLLPSMVWAGNCTDVSAWLVKISADKAYLVLRNDNDTLSFNSTSFYPDNVTLVNSENSSDTVSASSVITGWNNGTPERKFILFPFNCTSVNCTDLSKYTSYNVTIDEGALALSNGTDNICNVTSVAINSTVAELKFGHIYGLEYDDDANSAYVYLDFGPDVINAAALSDVVTFEGYLNGTGISSISSNASEGYIEFDNVTTSGSKCYVKVTLNATALYFKDYGILVSEVNNNTDDLTYETVIANCGSQNSGGGHPFVIEGTLKENGNSKEGCVIKAWEPTVKVAGFVEVYWNGIWYAFDASLVEDCLANYSTVYVKFAKNQPVDVSCDPTLGSGQWKVVKVKFVSSNVASLPGGGEVIYHPYDEYNKVLANTTTATDGSFRLTVQGWNTHIRRLLITANCSDDDVPLGIVNPIGYSSQQVNYELNSTVKLPYSVVYTDSDATGIFMGITTENASSSKLLVYNGTSFVPPHYGYYFVTLKGDNFIWPYADDELMPGYAYGVLLPFNATEIGMKAIYAINTAGTKVDMDDVLGSATGCNLMYSEGITDAPKYMVNKNIPEMWVFDNGTKDFWVLRNESGVVKGDLVDGTFNYVLICK